MENALTLTPKPSPRGPAARSWSNTYTPRADIYETENEVLVYVDLPGVRPENLELNWEESELTVHGRVTPSEAASLLVAEYDTGEYHRVFRISEDLDVTGITATLKNGVLTLRLPRAERVRPRKIPVQSS